MYATDSFNKFFDECFRINESSRVILYNFCLQGISDPDLNLKSLADTTGTFDIGLKCLLLMDLRQPSVKRKRSWGRTEIRETTTLVEPGPWNLSSLFDRVLKWYWVKRGRQEGRLLVEKVAFANIC